MLSTYRKEESNQPWHHFWCHLALSCWCGRGSTTTQRVLCSKSIPWTDKMRMVMRQGGYGLAEPNLVGMNRYYKGQITIVCVGTSLYYCNRCYLIYRERIKSVLSYDIPKQALPSTYFVIPLRTPRGLYSPADSAKMQYVFSNSRGESFLFGISRNK